MKFSIVTPTFNSQKHLSAAIYSVLMQSGAFDVEYLIIDNLSSDKTADIINCYIKKIPIYKKNNGNFEIKLVREKDEGMYEAINHGFSLASGDVFAWLNSDDVYLEGAFAAVAAVFELHDSIKWIKGITNYIDENGLVTRNGRCFLYEQDLIRCGLYGREAFFIQQDSTFWRPELWRAVGGIDTRFKVAGDYQLWMRFARFAPLFSLNRPVSCFRKVTGQLSENLAAYREEQQLIPRDHSVRIWLLRKFFSLLEPRLPDLIKFVLFRFMCPFAPLYCIDGDSGSARIRKLFKYVV